MENRNEIGKMFKDKMELLDKKPNDNIWTSIETDLNKKRKRRILLWFIPTFLSAVIVTSILLFGQTEQDKNNFVHEQEKQITVSKKSSFQDKEKNSETKKNSISQSNNSSGSNSVKSQKPNTELVVSQFKPTSKTTIGKSSETKTIIRKTRSEKLIKQSSKLIASTEDYEEYEVVKKYKVIIKKNKTITTTDKAIKTKATKKIQKKKAINGSKKKIYSTKKKFIIKTKKPTKIDNTISLKKKKINEPLLVIAKADTIKIDSLTKKTERKATSKREYIKKDYPEQKKETDPEYSISVYYGPAIFGSLANESTINKSFNDFSKSHPITSHYGVYFKAMYGKIGFRIGLAKINLKTSTTVTNASSIQYENIKLENINYIDLNNSINNDGSGEFEQKISYYEMPLEFNYHLKKDESSLGINAFSGFSILILDDNQLSFSSDSFNNKEIGETKTISQTNLSFNFGLGFNYKLTEKFQLNFNPIFKYYLTTYAKNNTPKPYSVSIQSGITYKF